MTDPRLSKTAALKAAQAACGSIHRRSGTDYVCYVPYYRDKPKGPTTEMQSYSRPSLVAMRARLVAEIALVLMQEWRSEDYETDVLIEAAKYQHVTTARDIVDYVLARQGGTPS